MPRPIGHTKSCVQPWAPWCQTFVKCWSPVCSVLCIPLLLCLVRTHLTSRLDSCSSSHLTNVTSLSTPPARHFQGHLHVSTVTGLFPAWPQLSDPAPPTPRIKSVKLAIIWLSLFSFVTQSPNWSRSFSEMRFVPSGPPFSYAVPQLTSLLPSSGLECSLIINILQDPVQTLSTLQGWLWRKRKKKYIYIYIYYMCVHMHAHIHTHIHFLTSCVQGCLPVLGNTKRSKSLSLPRDVPSAKGQSRRRGLTLDKAHKLYRLFMPTTPFGGR